MPFDEENDDGLPSPHSQKIGLKQVSSQKSIFDSIPKKPTQEEFNTKVKKIHDRDNSYKIRAAELATQFNKIMADKTLVQNKGPFAKEIEKEVLSNMINLAVEINNDGKEIEGMGSLTWITLLLKTCLSQRNKINQLEYSLSVLEKKLEPSALSKLISKDLDKSKNSE